MNNLYLFAEKEQRKALVNRWKDMNNNSNNKYAFAFYSFFMFGSSKNITYLK